MTRTELEEMRALREENRDLKALVTCWTESAERKRQRIADLTKENRGLQSQLAYLESYVPHGS